MSGKEFRRIIEETGLTREQAAQKLGISRRQVQRWLSGENGISPWRDRFIYAVFGIRPAWKRAGTVGPKRG